MATRTAASKTKGRTSISKSPGVADKSMSHRYTPNERKTQQNRGMDSGTHRGDRRDMSKTYTGNAKHAARGNTPRKDVKTRAR
jgi:hypothetical protein